MLNSVYLTQFFTIAVVHFFAVMSPGPDFAVVLKHSVSHGRKLGIITSMGVAFGIFIHVTYSLLGIGLILKSNVMVFWVVKMLGAGYLSFLGVSNLFSKAYKSETIESSEATLTAKKAIITGFLTNGLNPKATLFFLSLFTVIVTPDTPMLYQISYGIYLSIATFLWFCTVSVLFGHNRIRKLFLRFGHWFERIMGIILIALAFIMIIK